MNLLTKEEIDFILKESVAPKYRMQNLLHLGGNHTSVQRVSKKSGLIMIKGNDSTGFDHIMVRHDPGSKAAHWREDKVTLDNPSRFHLGTVPIYDYLKIADEVFKSENYVTDNRNKALDTFDLFIGPYADRRGRIMDYKLFLYKGTSIIHNLFPIKKTFNKKKVINLRKGFSNASLDAMRGIYTYNIPYYDHLNIERAKVIVRVTPHNRRENWSMQINDKGGQPIFTHVGENKTINTYMEMPFRCTSLDYHEDFSKIEGIMKVLIGNLNKVTGAQNAK